MDWNNGGAIGGPRITWDSTMSQGNDTYIDKIAVPQIKELLTNYGDFPSIIWWDWGSSTPKDGPAKIYEMVKSLKPNIIMNNRLGGGYDGDIEVYESSIPVMGIPNKNWESCITLNDSRGYKNDDQNWKSSQYLITSLIDIVSKGGNFLLNIGHDGEGIVPKDRNSNPS